MSLRGSGAGTRWILLAWLGFTTGAVSTVGAQSTPQPTPDVVKFTVLHMNDIYELNPFRGGAIGGLARVATIRKELLKENPQTITVLAGDLFSPSPMGNVPSDDPWDGRQMVSTMNALGLDFAVLGNHEFDLKTKPSFLARIAESKFTWLSANVVDEKWEPFNHVLKSKIQEFVNPDGRKMRVAIVGLTTASTDRDYVRYRDWVTAARRELASVRAQCDIVIGLTHLDIEDDLNLARNVDGFHFIMGGHEHEANYVVPPFPFQPPIAKADANDKTVWIHRFAFDTVARTLTVDSTLRPIDNTIADEPATQAVIAKWTADYAGIFVKQYGMLFAPYKAEGPPTAPAKPSDRVKTTLNTSLEGRDEFVRTRPTNLGRFIAGVYLGTLPKADDTDKRPRVAFYNSGSVRIDDVIEAGTSMTFYDVLRILPFQGDVKHTHIRGVRLLDILNRSENSLKNSGAYLQYAGIRNTGKTGWQIDLGEGKSAPIDGAQEYLVALSEYLWKGDQKGFDDLKGLPDDTKEKLSIQVLVAKALAASPKIEPDQTTPRIAIEPHRVAVVHVGPREVSPTEPPAQVPIPTVSIPTVSQASALAPAIKAIEQATELVKARDVQVERIEARMRDRIGDLESRLSQRQMVESYERFMTQMQLWAISILLLFLILLIVFRRKSRPEPHTSSW